ncbi:hypothetical protein [Pseudomonas sp. R5(2019)]|uniref:hypothetical protein n=1 Tax=Pseudomonas sp. R5(2019) TaxID=2697566 RepID=UPI001412A53A|nr:hypothetical protein [Pseudomonas sp. R5(2019)]NBA98558.1 hypothetical protein [Pseudomonas sp. R5(2019)]
MDSVRETFIWQGLTIETLHTPNWSEIYRTTYGYALSHLQISAAERAPLPISATGYVSHFERADNIEAEGGAVAYVQAWLEHAAQSPAWIEAQQKARQLSLF